MQTRPIQENCQPNIILPNGTYDPARSRERREYAKRWRSKGYKLREIADAMGVSIERVIQLLKKPDS